ncbi:MAG TPA: MarR family transcriptional regulator [Pseudonocardiaceae bacterium]|nr:MarR family transcriptional regulator [Pseudonocardiaceae bacterium]
MDRQEALARFGEASYTLSAADARLRGRATRIPGALSFPHARALRVLAELGPLTIGQLAGHTETTGPAVTQLVNGLVAAGYVTRSRPEDDRRTVLVAITDAGRARHQERQLVLADAFDQAIGHLGAEELAAAAEVLRALSTVYDRL